MIVIMMSLVIANFTIEIRNISNIVKELGIIPEN
jgi:hypothetical protein